MENKGCLSNDVETKMVQIFLDHKIKLEIDKFLTRGSRMNKKLVTTPSVRNPNKNRIAQEHNLRISKLLETIDARISPKMSRCRLAKMLRNVHQTNYLPFFEVGSAH